MAPSSQKPECPRQRHDLDLCVVAEMAGAPADAGACAASRPSAAGRAALARRLDSEEINSAVTRKDGYASPVRLTNLHRIGEGWPTTGDPR